MTLVSDSTLDGRSPGALDLDLLSTPGAVDEIRQAEADISAGEGIDAGQLAARAERERRG